VTASPERSAEAVVWQLDGQLLDALDSLCRPPSEASYERVEAGAYLVRLPGERRRSTVVWLIAGPQAVAVEAFVMHVTADCADPAPLHRLLLARNLRLRDVHFALDEVGDVFLVGSLPHSALEVGAVDRLLGEVLEALEAGQPVLERAAYGDGPLDEALLAKVRTDGSGRRPAGTPLSAPRRDARR
jgi:hypothetical protein